MAKVLISHIGTGRQEPGIEGEYLPTIYKFNENEDGYNTTFLAAALSDYLRVDKIIFIGTAKSMWQEIYRYFTEKAGGKVDVDYWVKVADLSSKSNYKEMLVDNETLKDTVNAVDNYLKKINFKKTGKSAAMLIKYGLNEEELWENFERIMEVTEILQDGDEVYIDITHAFRSIPLFIYLLMDFIQILNYKDIEIKGLYYGMFEVNNEKGYTPVIDLSPLLKISKWIIGTHNFINYGNGYLISELSKKEEKLSKRMKNISDLININYLLDLQSQIKGLNKEISKEISIEAMKYIIPVLKKFIVQFENTKAASEFQLELSRWYFENKRYGHGYICLTEAILTKICEVFKLDIALDTDREKAKNFIRNRKFRKDCGELENLYRKYKAISKIRNRIAHASFFQRGNFSFRTDIDSSMNYFVEIKDLLNSKEINELNEKFTLVQA